MIVYLAHPIDLRKDDPEHESLVDDIKADLYDAGFVVYDPEAAFLVPGELTPDESISLVNQAAMEQASAYVVVSPEVQTIGTVLELAYAVQSGKPVIVVSTAAYKSWALAGLTNRSNVALSEGWQATQAVSLRGMVMSASVLPPPPIRALNFMFNEESGGDAFALDFGPSRSYKGDAGFDLYVTQDVEIPIGQFRDVPCGINVEFPEGVWGLIIGRSSTLRKHNLMVTPGVIDNGYRGPLYAGVYNLNGEQFSAKRGMRLAQLIPFPLTAQSMRPWLVPALGESDRGSSGFGSTGV